MAMANEKIKHDSGPVDEYAVISAYTDAEDAIIQQAAKNQGIKGVVVSDQGSNEPDDTTSASPVARVKKNRYGV
jgi:L-asparaginase/Glu-tRNA(Gln) amidotransferase subunit D